MNERSLRILALIALSAASGCAAARAPAGESQSDEAAATRHDVPSPVNESTDRPTSAFASVAGIPASIFDVRRPDSTIADGARIRIDAPGVRVTAFVARTLFIQEAGDDGTCESGSNVVAHRAIEVTLAAPLDAAGRPAPPPARGARVVVEGIVTARGSRRVVENATVTVLDEPVHEYEPHCDRHSRAVDDEALDAVLLRIAGMANDGAVSVDDGSWSLSTCFGGDARIGTRMVSYEDRRSTWHWVTGIAVSDVSGARLEPRDTDDIDATGQNDACL
jgi:hypothetical protein